jgi:iron complex outermembrane receptor protein
MGFNLSGTGATPLLAGLLLLHANLAVAEEINAYQLDTIFVTATRLGETDLQTTPIAITTFDSETMDTQGLSNTKDIGQRTPGLSIANHGTRGQVYIRGVGTNNVFAGSDPSSTIHLDGVYLARPNSVLTEFMDVEWLEVLKGPQGTLYGRNSTGGNINIVSAEPSEEFYFKAKLEYGNFDRRRAAFNVNGPLAGDALMGNLALYRNLAEGYVTNVNPAADSDLNDEDTYGIKGALKWRITDSLTALLRSDYSKADDTNYSSYKPTLADAVGNPIVPTDMDAGAPITIAPPTAPQDIGDYHTINVPVTPEREDKQQGVSLKLTAELTPNLTFTSLTAGRSLDHHDRRDWDFTEVDSHLSTMEEDQEQFSQEFSLQGNHDAINWITGVYYFQEQDRTMADMSLTLFDVYDAFGLNGGNSLIWTLPVFVNTRARNTAMAAFAQADVNLTDNFSIVAGTRYNYDRKNINDLTDGNPSASDSWEAWTPKLGLNYRISDQVFTYASASRGYKSGGYNAADLTPFDPETLTAYEVGIKSDLWDNRLRFNASAFYYDYENIQIQQFNNLGIIISNVPEAEARGGEIEITAIPSDEWQFDLGIALLDTEYGDFVSTRDTFITASVPMQQQANASGGTLSENIKGNSFNVAPEVTVNFTAQYFQNFDAGSITYRLDYYWQDDEYYNQYNDANMKQDAYHLVDASATFTSNKGDWQFVLYGKNLTDTEYASYAYDFSNLGTAFSINPPRTYGARLIYHYD